MSHTSDDPAVHLYLRTGFDINGRANAASSVQSYVRLELTKRRLQSWRGVLVTCKSLNLVSASIAMAAPSVSPDAPFACGSWRAEFEPKGAWSALEVADLVPPLPRGQVRFLSATDGLTFARSCGIPVGLLAKALRQGSAFDGPDPGDDDSAFLRHAICWHNGALYCDTSSGAAQPLVEEVRRHTLHEAAANADLAMALQELRPAAASTRGSAVRSA